MTDHIRVTLKEGIQHIQIKRVEKKNAIASPMYSAMADALNASNGNDDIKVNLLYGEKGCFTAGNDIKDFLKFAQTGALDDAVLVFLSALNQQTKPLILAIDGPAIGIGTTMVFHADLVYATKNALFQTPFLDLGLVPEAASSYLMPATMGHHRAFEMLVLGNSFDAQKAQQAGFVNDILDPSTLIEDCHKTALRLANKPAGALKLARDLMRTPQQETTQQVMQKESDLFKAQLSSSEAKAAFFAFLSKSK